jgi:hypothetical protein
MMAGLINTTAQPAIVAPPATKPVTPVAWNVTKPQTVQGQVAGIIAENSPLQQLATTSATQQANTRGLVNSSMAVGAAQDATIKSALPIAQQDAQTYGAAAQANAAAKNDTSKFNAELSSKEGMFAAEQSGLNTRFAQEQAGIGERFATEQAGIGERFAAEQSGLNTRFTQELEQNMEQFNLSEANKTALLDLEQQYKQSIQTSANTATLFNSYFQQIAAIQTSPNLDADGKETAIANLTTMLQDGVAAQDAVSGLNIEALVFPDAPATTPAAPTTAPAVVTPSNSSNSSSYSSLSTNRDWWRENG